MKKSVHQRWIPLCGTLIIVTFFILNGLLKPIRAQTLTSDRAYQDYQYSQTVYDQAYSDYTDARDAYLQGGKTLPLKDTATQKTFSMLVDRDQLMVVYLTALRAKIAELKGLSNDYKNAIFGKIDGEVNFYSNHKSAYHSTDTSDQLFATGSQSQAQYTKTTSLIVNESLFDISLGEEAGTRQSQEQIYTTLKSVINNGVAAGKLTLDPFGHWFTDIDATDSQLVQNENTAVSQIQAMYTQTYAVQESYTTSIGTLTSSLKTLSQMNEYLTEVVNYIQNQP